MLLSLIVTYAGEIANLTVPPLLGQLVGKSEGSWLTYLFLTFFFVLYHCGRVILRHILTLGLGKNKVTRRNF